MTPHFARIWIIKSSLICYGLSFVFFALAPSVGYPLDYSDAINILKVLLPVFAGYLGAATLFLGVEVPDTKEAANKDMLSLLVRWPIVIFCICMLSILAAFPISHWGSFDGTGMTPNTLSLLVSLLAGLLAATTGGVTSYLFKLEKRG